MASAAQIKELLKTHSEGNDERFYAIAMQMAAAEARKVAGYQPDEFWGGSFAA